MEMRLEKEDFHNMFGNNFSDMSVKAITEDGDEVNIESVVIRPEMEVTEDDSRSRIFG